MGALTEWDQLLEEQKGEARSFSWQAGSEAHVNFTYPNCWQLSNMRMIKSVIEFSKIQKVP